MSAAAERSVRVHSVIAIGLLLAMLVSTLGARPAVANDALETYGDIAQIAIPAIGGIISIARKDVDGVIQLGVGTVVTIGVVQGLKYAVDLDRPNGGRRGFPSGHTAGAFAGASYLHYRYGWKWGLPAYAAAAVVGYSRVEADKHYWYDVVGGAAIANLIAYVVTDTFDDSVVIIPILDTGKHNFGLLARIRF